MKQGFRRKAGYGFAAAVLMALLLSGCGRTAQTVSFTAMDTLMDLTVYGRPGDAERAEAVIEDMERRASVTDPDSEISALNRDGSRELDPETADLLRTALDLCEETGGALDISIYPVVRAWGFTTGTYRIPSEAERRELLKTVDYRAVTLKGNRAALAPGMEIDLGAVAKGYAGMKAAQALRARGVKSALLSLGGNVQTVGGKPDGSPWRIAVQDPAGDGFAGVLEIRDLAAVTSGGYQRFFEQDGVVYWHIMDPAAGAPVRSGLTGVTIVAENGAYCDALSTALFVMGRERAEAFWRERRDFGMVLITEDGEVVSTPDLSFEPTPGLPYRYTVLDP